MERENKEVGAMQTCCRLTLKC